MKNKKDKYLGLENYNNKGYLMKIVTYNTYNDIEVEFFDPCLCKVKTGTGHFLKGNVTNPYAPGVFNVGMVGNKCPTTTQKNKVKEYNIWYSVLRRSFSDYYKTRFPTYKDVTCDPIWFYYDNFYDWIHEQSNYEKIKDLNYNIDKDILFKGNKLYAPDRCTLVPKNVNMLLIKQENNRGKYPIGVIFDKKKGYYSAYCNEGKNQKHINNYKTEQEAFNAYKKYKENVIKKIAKEEYNNGTITEKCYEALMNYRVEITD